MINKILYVIIGCAGVLLISIGAFLLLQPPLQPPPPAQEQLYNPLRNPPQLPKQSQLVNPFRDVPQPAINSDIKSWENYFNEPRTDAFERPLPWERPLPPPPSSVEGDTQAQLDEYQARLQAQTDEYEERLDELEKQRKQQLDEYQAHIDELEKKQKQQLREQYWEIANQYETMAEDLDYPLRIVIRRIAQRDPLSDPFYDDAAFSDIKQRAALWELQEEYRDEARHYRDLAGGIR